MVDSLSKRLRKIKWSLPDARALADEVGRNKLAVRMLVREFFGDDTEVRKRAADVTRHITDSDGRLLEPYADEIAGLLGSLPPHEACTRWHLGLIVPRIAQTYIECDRRGQCPFWRVTKATPSGALLWKE